MDQTALVPSEAITVVLSERGWIRAAKGHDMDPLALGSKSGDAFKAFDRGRSNQSAVFLDSTGRTYTLPAHTLPSARGQGEPLSGRVKPPAGAVFAGIMIGDADDRYLLASDAGYGFVARLGDLQSKNKSGKSVLTRPNDAGVLRPQPVRENDDGWVAAVTSSGYLLVTELEELPLLGRGKGLKIIHIPPMRLTARDEFVVAIAVVPDGGQLTVHAGKRYVTLKPSDLEHYQVGRGRRGKKLPRGLQRVERLVAGD
jgi:topoisomerase-4 subunit A